jgi:hypothetical protein
VGAFGSVPLVLTSAQRRILLLLLGELRNYTQSEIRGYLIPGTSVPMPRHVPTARALLSLCEDMITELDRNPDRRAAR